MTRISKLDMVECIALTYAERSSCTARAQVGAVLYDDDFRIVAGGYNGVPQGFPHCDDVGCTLDAAGSCIMAVHAEMNAILQCAAVGISTKGLHLYTTVSPCDRCAIAIVRAGIVSVIYTTEYHREGHAPGIFLRARIPCVQRDDSIIRSEDR